MANKRLLRFAALSSVRCLGAKVVLLVLFAWLMQVNAQERFTV